MVVNDSGVEAAGFITEVLTRMGPAFALLFGVSLSLFIVRRGAEWFRDLVG